MDRNCQNCDKRVEESWTLCKACRRGYARLLHRLRVNLYRLQSVARREYRLSEPGNGGRPQVFLVKSVFRVSSLIFFGFRHEECRPVVCFTGCPSCRT